METRQDSIWRTRLEGHFWILAMPVLCIVVSASRAREADGRLDIVPLLLGVPPAILGWIFGALAFELGLRRGEGRPAIWFGVRVCGGVAALNILLLYGVAHWWLKMA